ncbi:MAG: alpha/beta hydrolase [Candidatus Lokiarchaeota archaeon]|nr:alpha/beta hydrolase [Candidatus Lokiarchaeota archaeon]
MIAEANGIKISYDLKGKGFPLILIHGFGSKKEIWKPQIIDFSKKYKTITFDLRGTGKTDRPNYPYTMEMFADDIKGLMDYLKIESVHLIGRSLGGMIAQNFVLKYPQNVKKLVLIATNAIFDNESVVDLIINNRIKDIELLKKDPVKAFWNKSLFVYHQKFRRELKQNPKKKFFNVFSLEDLIEESTINPSRAQDIINQGNAMKGHNTLNRLSEIKNETLLLAASHDRLIPKSLMVEINKRIPNSILKIIDKAGHFMTVSRATEVNNIILDFLNSK